MSANAWTDLKSEDIRELKSMAKLPVFKDAKVPKKHARKLRRIMRRNRTGHTDALLSMAQILIGMGKAR